MCPRGDGANDSDFQKSRDGLAGADRHGSFGEDLAAGVEPCVLGVALHADKKRYAPGPGVLCHFSERGVGTGRRSSFRESMQRAPTNKVA